MASIPTWVEFNGNAGDAGTDSRGDGDFKSVDDSTTLYSDALITAGQNSMAKVQAIKFAGTWTSLSDLSYSIDNPTPAAGIEVHAAVLTADPRPNTSSPTGDPLFSSPLPALFAATPANPWGTAWAAIPGGAIAYGQALRTQILTTVDAPQGDGGPLTITASWTES